jgi:prolyl-tRNA synthetase
MKQSKLFSRTKKEVPKDIDAISHKLLYRGDFIDQLGSGIYGFLPLGWMVHQKITKIIREEMFSIGAQEVFLPSLHPKNIWQTSGRWDSMRPPLFKIKDSHKKEFALGSTHEEVMAKIAKSRIISYKDLPFALFQFQTKFRNELRYTGGLLRTREFVMKDLYSFHSTEEDFKEYYEIVAKIYFKIFKRCGLLVKRVKASGEGFTASFTDEFQALTKIGEDTIIYCPKCDFAQNKEIANQKEGDKCPQCGAVLKQEKGIEVGNIFPLGTKYSEPFNLYFVDKKGEKNLVIMASYGIGIGRLLATIVETHNDAKGIVWPEEVAPYSVHLLAINMGEKMIVAEAEKIYKDLQNQGIEVLYDDRQDVSAGEKLIESDLLGIPTRIIISKKTLESDSVEIKKRNEEKVKLEKISQLKNYTSLII